MGHYADRSGIIIVIITQDNTIIRKMRMLLNEIYINLYGEKLWTKIYDTVKKGRIGAFFRRCGELFDRAVLKEQAEKIQ